MVGDSTIKLIRVSEAYIYRIVGSALVYKGLPTLVSDVRERRGAESLEG